MMIRLRDDTYLNTDAVIAMYVDSHDTVRIQLVDGGVTTITTKNHEAKNTAKEISDLINAAIISRSDK